MKKWLLVITLVISVFLIMLYFKLNELQKYKPSERTTSYTIYLENLIDYDLHDIEIFTDDEILQSIDLIMANEIIEIEFDTMLLANEYNVLRLGKYENDKKYIHLLDNNLVGGFGSKLTIKILDINEDGSLELEIVE